MLRVGLDAHMVGGHETGNETYVKGLVEGFKACDEDIEVVVYHVAPPWTAAGRRIRYRRLATASPYVRLGIELPLRSLGHLDVLHTTYAAPVWSRVPVVITIHDICYVTNPEWFSPRDLRVLRTVMPRSIKRAAHVITDSESARRQIMQEYQVPEANISAIPIGPGFGADPLDPEAARQELGALGLDPERPYLLTVGNLQPRKNLVRLVEAFHRLGEVQSTELDLVIVGPRHFRADDVFKAVGPSNSRIHLTGYVTDRQLAACYRCSTAFVLPSLYEGFGLPVLEAMAHGVPIACSNAGALPELCAGAAVLFDPRSVDDMLDALKSILDDGDLRQRLKEAGLARAKSFSWKRTAELTLAVYRKVTG